MCYSYMMMASGFAPTYKEDTRRLNSAHVKRGVHRSRDVAQRGSCISRLADLSSLAHRARSHASPSVTLVVALQHAVSKLPTLADAAKRCTYKNARTSSPLHHAGTRSERSSRAGADW